MSDELLNSLRDTAMPALEEMAGGLADQFLAGMKDVLDDASAATKAKVEGILQEGARFKWKAMTADDQETARQYAEAVETSIRRVKTLLIAERIVAEESVAAVLSNLWEKSLDGFVSVAKGLLATVASGLVQGAIKGLTGGGEDGSLDSSDIFPFA